MKDSQDKLIISKDIYTGDEVIKECRTCHNCGEEYIRYVDTPTRLCHKCGRDVTHPNLPYYYIECVSCHRTYYSITSKKGKAGWCIECLRTTKLQSYNHSKVLYRLKTAITPDQLMSGEIFMVKEYPNTIFIKYNKRIHHYSGLKTYKAQVVKNSYNVYKVKNGYTDTNSDMAITTARLTRKIKEWKMKL